MGSDSSSPSSHHHHPRFCSLPPSPHAYDVTMLKSAIDIIATTYHSHDDVKHLPSITPPIAQYLQQGVRSLRGVAPCFFVLKGLVSPELGSGLWLSTTSVMRLTSIANRHQHHPSSSAATAPPPPPPQLLPPPPSATVILTTSYPN